MVIEGITINKYATKAISDGLYRKRFCFSIKKCKNCLFSRRTGKVGTLLFGYSILINFFGKNIL